MDEKPKVKHIRTKAYVASIYYEVLLNQRIDELKGADARWANTARYTHARGLRKARGKQRQIVYKRVESSENEEYKKTAGNIS